MAKKNKKTEEAAFSEKNEADFVRREEERILREQQTEEAKNDDDGRVYALASLAVGILSFVAGASIVFPIVGIRFSNMGRKSAKARIASIGKNLCVTALVMWLFVWAMAITAIIVLLLSSTAHSAIKNW